LINKNDLFGDKGINYDKNSRITKIKLIIAVISCLSIQICYAFIADSKGITYVLFNALIISATSLFISILASFYYAQFENKDLKEILGAIENSGPDGLISTTIKEFRGFNGGYMTNYNYS
jgi:hypothetical protein